MAGYQILTGIGERSKSFATTFLKFFLYVFLIILAIVILKGVLKTDELVMQPISAPKAFIEAGYQGNIIAQRLHEEIENLYQNSTTIRQDSTFINVDQSKDINMNVMGLGVSASNIIYHLRDLLGIQTNYITGHLTDLNDVLSLKLSVSNPKGSRTIRLPYTTNQKLQVFDSLLFEGAKFITELQNPYRLAVYYNQNGDDENALKVIRKLVKSPGEKKWAYNLWANIIKNKTSLHESIEFYQLALQEDPNFELAHRNLGQTYFQMDSLDLALQYFENSKELDPNSWNTINMLALLHGKEGNSEKAKELFETNLTNHASELGSYSNYASFLMAREEVEEIPKLFQKAKNQNFENDEFYIIKSGYYSFLGKLDSANIFIDKALLFNPNNIDALMSKANIIGERDGRIAAIPHMERVLVEYEAAEANDGLLNTLNSLAVAEYENGRYDFAHKHILRAIDIAPNYGLLNTTLAEVYYLKGMKEKFYENIIIAYEKGSFIREDWFEDMPYDQLKDDIRLREIMNKYRPEILD